MQHRVWYFLLTPGLLWACGDHKLSPESAVFSIRETHIAFLRSTRNFSQPDSEAQQLGFKKAAYPYYAPSDGCSGGISERGMERFRAACIEHDVCYRIGSGGRKACDKAFLNAMRIKCNALAAAAHKPCYAEARAMYEAVRIWSGDVFDNRQRNQMRYEDALSQKSLALKSVASTKQYGR
jgi:hypothetical protein